VLAKHLIPALPQPALKPAPLSDWAVRLLGDGRISEITLQDILGSVDDYFTTFERMRKFDSHAYKYFSRVGVPIVTPHTMVYANSIDAPPMVTNGDRFPSLFGAFFAKPKDLPIDDDSSLDFQYFFKPHRHAIPTPAGVTLFAHNGVALKRDREELLRRFEWARSTWGFGWFAGVYPDGSVKALPCHMNRQQVLPNGDLVHHSEFRIPKALSQMIDGKDHHAYVHLIFSVIVACTASALSGIQVSIRRGKTVARIGVPITSLKSFFSDRDPEGSNRRRKAILHLRNSHRRQLADGRVITVGEHLSGQRNFRWRDYDISVGVPGIHYPSPEGFSAVMLGEDEDTDKPTVSLNQLAKTMGKRVREPRPSRFRKGVPAITFVDTVLS